MSYRGVVDTDMIKIPLMMPDGDSWTVQEDENLPSLIKRFAKPEETAASVAFLLGDESKMVTKQEWHVDGGWCESNSVGVNSKHIA